MTFKLYPTEALNPKEIARFWAKVDRSGGPSACWEWTACKRGGYGLYKINRFPKGPWSAHKLAFILLHGQFPQELSIDHLCRNHSCCNPAHMEPVTPAENTRRGISHERNRDKTHCPHGHPYSPENTILYLKTKTGKPFRQCRRCSEIRPHVRTRPISL